MLSKGRCGFIKAQFQRWQETGGCSGSVFHTSIRIIHRHEAGNSVQSLRWWILLRFAMFWLVRLDQSGRRAAVTNFHLKPPAFSKPGMSLA